MRANRLVYVLVGVAIVALLANYLWSKNNPIVVINTPKEGSVISSPVLIRGEAPGRWFFEANIVVRVIDEQGNVLGAGPGMATSDWMTIEPVPFEIILPFDVPTTDKGFIMIEADNPSGAPNPPSYKMPIKFAKQSTGMMCGGSEGVCMKDETEEISI